VEPKNKKFYEAILKFVKASIDRLNEYTAKGEKVTIIIDEIPIIDERGFQGVKNIERPFYRDLVFDHRKDLEQLAEFATVTLLSRDIPPLAGSIAQIFPFHFLDKYLENARRLQFEKEIFDNIYIDYETHLYMPRNSYRYFILLLNFQSESEKIELDGGITIHRVTPDVIEKLWGILQFSDFFRRHEILNTKFMMEMIYQHPKGESIDSNIILNIFNKVISALRIYKEGVPYFDRLYHIPLYYPSMDIGATGQIIPRLTISNKKYNLKKEEESEFVKYWKFFKDISENVGKHEYINIALRRFNYALIESEQEDKLIDIMIALEALYLKELDELKYRLSLRIAILLGKTDEQRMIIKNFIGESYKVRSMVVHGKKIKKIKIEDKHISLKELILKLKSYLRQSIYIFLKLKEIYYDHDSIIDMLEKAILNPSLREDISKISEFK